MILSNFRTQKILSFSIECNCFFYSFSFFIIYRIIDSKKTYIKLEFNIEKKRKRKKEIIFINYLLLSFGEPGLLGSAFPWYLTFPYEKGT